MKIHYICHSTLLIETKNHKILTDPWLSGSVYCDQWHLFPLPVNANLANSADVILTTHGHEDHLHYDSLVKLNKNAQFFFPFQWQKGIKSFLNELGYQKVTEAITNKTYSLSDGTKITYIANALDSLLVIESDGEVMVNINDALPANHVNIINRFTDMLKQKWPKIDYLFCGYGSAAYFPNTVHCEGKNDLEIAETREQLFAHNFCTIMNNLKPKYTIPFAADYVLLNNSRKWINNIKLSKYEIQDYYHQVFKEPVSSFLVMHSGDTIDNGRLNALSLYHEVFENNHVDQLMNEQLNTSEKRVNEITYINAEQTNVLLAKMKANIKGRMPLFKPEVLSKIKFCVFLQDVQEEPWVFIEFTAEGPQVQRLGHRHEKAVLTMETNSKILNYCFDSEWGGDAIVIGYGAEIFIHDKNIISQNLDIVCVRLLTRQPVASKQMKASPLRALKYLATNPITTRWAIQQVMNGRKNVNKNPINERNLWLNKSKCEICQVCNMPYLDNDFSESLK